MKHSLHEPPDIEHCAQQIVEALQLKGADRELQLVQTRHRVALVRFWGIQPGDRVLEIGCGQGDTTAALAHAVGSNGLVHAVDPAPASFGAPTTLGAATQALKRSSLGAQLRFTLGAKDVSQPDRFAHLEFDHVVFSHCAWYFASRSQWLAQLTVARRWANRLCVAEWDMRADRPAHWAHALAVLIQAQQEALDPQGEANVRTLLSPQDLLESASDAGWKLQNECVVDTRNLQDGTWEIDMACDAHGTLRYARLPAQIRQLLETQRALMLHHAKAHGRESLNTFVLTASRGD